MSSRRSRSGGRWTSIVFRRNSRSCRNRPAGDFGVEIGVGRRDQPDVDLARLGRSEPLELAGLDHAQQLGLLAERHVGDFVEEERAAVGELEAADAIDLRVGERALHVAEELRLEDALGHAAGVDRHHRTVGARRHGVQRLRDQALAGAVLAGDEDVGVRRADARDDVEHRPHRRRFGEQRRVPVGHQRLVRRFELPPAPDRAAQLGLRPHDRQQPLVVPRLLDEVARAAAHRLDRHVDRSPRRHHDNRQRFVGRVNPLQQVEPFFAGRRVARVVEVHQDDVVVLELHRAKQLLRRRRRVDDVALRLQQQAQRLEHIGLIVADQDARRRLAASEPDRLRVSVTMCSRSVQVPVQVQTCVNVSNCRLCSEL